jgi:hypothetical protein
LVAPHDRQVLCSGAFHRFSRREPERSPRHPVTRVGPPPPTDRAHDATSQETCRIRPEGSRVWHLSPQTVQAVIGSPNVQSPLPFCSAIEEGTVGTEGTSLVPATCTVPSVPFVPSSTGRGRKVAFPCVLEGRSLIALQRLFADSDLLRGDTEGSKLGHELGRRSSEVSFGKSLRPQHGFSEPSRRAPVSHWGCKTLLDHPPEVVSKRS